MKKIILINLLLLLVFTLSIEAKGSKGRVGKAIVNKIAKSIPKIKKMTTSSRKSKISNKNILKIKSLKKSRNVILSDTKTNLRKLGKKVSSAKVRKTIPEKPGLYGYKEKSNKPYLGLSENLKKRTLSHLSTGKLPYQNINTVRTKNVPKIELRSREKELIIKADKYTNGGLANIQHAKLSRKNHLFKTEF
jgi:hypothetical protein